MHAAAWLHLEKNAVMLMSRRLELDEIQMSWTGLVDMYAKCGSMEDAWRVFNKLPSCNVVTWKAMVLDMYNVGIQAQKAMELLEVKPPRSTNITEWFTTLEEIKSTVQERAWLNGLQTAVQLVLANEDALANLKMASDLIEGRVYAK